MNDEKQSPSAQLTARDGTASECICTCGCNPDLVALARAVGRREGMLYALERVRMEFMKRQHDLYGRSHKRASNAALSLGYWLLNGMNAIEYGPDDYLLDGRITRALDSSAAGGNACNAARRVLLDEGAAQ